MIECDLLSSNMLILQSDILCNPLPVNVPIFEVGRWVTIKLNRERF